jgi:hypothetical protein
MDIRPTAREKRSSAVNLVSITFVFFFIAIHQFVAWLFFSDKSECHHKKNLFHQDPSQGHLGNCCNALKFRASFVSKPLSACGALYCRADLLK